MSFTDAELLAVARVVWPQKSYRSDENYLREVARCAAGWKANPSPRVAELCVRLALEHPTKAGEALGPGWRVERWWGEAGEGVVFIFAGEGFELIVREGGERFDLDTGVTWWVIPPEFNAALQRALLIAAAWQRIEAAK